MTAVRETESGYQDAIVSAAHILGWRVAHFRAARTAHGWRTPAQYDAKGFPDLILTRVQDGRVLAIEVKSERGKLSHEQLEWLADLGACGIETLVATPADWDAVAGMLR